MAPARRIRAYPVQRSGGHDRWMISYMDVVTILLILFVALAAQSLQHPKKFVVAAAPVPVAVKVASPPKPVTPSPQPRSVLLATQEKLRAHGLDSRLEPAPSIELSGGREVVCLSFRRRQIPPSFDRPPRSISAP